MRRTLWVATPDALRAMHAATTRRLVERERRRTLGLLQVSGVPDPESWLDDARDQVLAALHAHGPMTARALGNRVPALRRPLEMSPGKRYAATVSAHTRVLLELGFEGVLVRDPPDRDLGQRAVHLGGRPTPGCRAAADGIDPRAAAGDLVARCLGAFGPVTTDRRAVVGRLAGRPRSARRWPTAAPWRSTSTARPGWVAAGDGDLPPAGGEPWVALLPSLDPDDDGLEAAGVVPRPGLRGRVRPQRQRRRRRCGSTAGWSAPGRSARTGRSAPTCSPGSAARTSGCWQSGSPRWASCSATPGSRPGFPAGCTRGWSPERPTGPGDRLGGPGRWARSGSPMLFTPLITTLAEASQGGINKWIVGGIMIGLFLITMLVLLAFGAGRDHS